MRIDHTAPTPSAAAPAVGAIAETSTVPSVVRAGFALAGLFCLAGALFVDPARATSDGTVGIAPDFATLDADANGTLTRKEWMMSSVAATMSDGVAAAHYAMYDVDGNGGVSAAEYARVNAEVLDGMKAKAI